MANSIRRRDVIRLAGGAAAWGVMMFVALACLVPGAAAESVEAPEATIRATLQKWAADFNAKNAGEICGLFASELRYDYRGHPSAITGTSVAYCIIRWKTGLNPMPTSSRSRRSWFQVNSRLYGWYGRSGSGRITLRDSRNRSSPVWTYSASSRTEAGRSSVIWPMQSRSECA